MIMRANPVTGGEESFLDCVIYNKISPSTRVRMQTESRAFLFYFIHSLFKKKEGTYSYLKREEKTC